MYLRRSSPEGLAEWSRQRDPEGKAWKYDEKLKRYFPIVD
jgi:hypothetical protein